MEDPPSLVSERHSEVELGPWIEGIPGFLDNAEEYPQKDPSLLFDEQGNQAILI